MKLYFDSTVKDFFGDITILPEQMKVASLIALYATQYHMSVAEFSSMTLEELYAFTDTLNNWSSGREESTTTTAYSPVYIRSFQNYIKKAVSAEQLDKALMDSALVDHAVKKLLTLIDDDSFDDSNLVGYQRADTDTGSSVRKTKYDKLKAIDILLKYATASEANKNKQKASATPSLALTNLMRTLIGTEEPLEDE